MPRLRTVGLIVSASAKDDVESLTLADSTISSPLSTVPSGALTVTRTPLEHLLLVSVSFATLSTQAPK